MRSRESSATAARIAPISSGSGGSGMYSLAPAWMAATAARALLSVPQATIGAWICSFCNCATRSAISSATSTMRRSAPRPERRTAMACSIESAWVTAAPLSIAYLVARVSCPLSVPTMRRRMGSAPFRFDDFSHGHAKLVLNQNHFATRDQAIVDVDVDGFADLAVEFEHGPGADFQELPDIHLGASEHGRDLNR